MKYFYQVLAWIFAIGAVFASTGASLIQADPSDDFSFSLVHGPEIEAYNLMSEHRVAAVFAERLDLFPKSQVPKLAKHFLKLCAQYRFDPAFVLSLIEVESRFQTRAVSPAGAIGLMQVMPATASTILRNWELGYRDDFEPNEKALMDPFFNLSLGIAYLAWLRDRYENMSPYYLVAAYNVGPARLDELLARKNFRPTKTKLYFDAIRRGVHGLRFFGSKKG